MEDLATRLAVSIHVAVLLVTVGIDVKQILMSVSQTLAVMEVPVLMGWLPSPVCAFQATLGCIAKRIQKHVTTAGINSRVIATSTSPRGETGTQQRESAVCMVLISPASCHMRSNSLSTVLDKTTSGSA